LNNISFYNFKNKKIIPDNKIKEFSLLIRQEHIEYFLRVYCLDLHLKNTFIEFFKCK